MKTIKKQNKYYGYIYYYDEESGVSHGLDNSYHWYVGCFIGYRYKGGFGHGIYQSYCAVTCRIGYRYKNEQKGFWLQNK